MNWQEIIVFSLVLIAAWFVGRRFLHQFTRGENASPGCAKCGLNKAVNETKDGQFQISKSK
jgi:hypothetical protein